MNLTGNFISRCSVSARVVLVAFALLLSVGGLCNLKAADGADIPQFDIFVGFEATTMEANWFPVVCEVRNEGPTFTAVFEFFEGNEGSDFVRRMPIELPTGTLKRFSFPMYSPGRYGTQFGAVLRTPNGRAIKRASNINPNTHLRWNSQLLCAIPASATGLPLYPGSGNTRERRNQAIAHVARLQSEMVPDTPLALGAMDALYLNSQRAVELEDPQVGAILSWLHGGGHLILGVDAVLDVNGVPWLKALMPGELGGLKAVPVGDALFEWVKEGVSEDRGTSSGDPYRSLAEDTNFAGANMRVHEIDLKRGRVDLEVDGQPLIVSTPRERGRLTVLIFNPELEPIRSWNHRS